MQIFVFLAQSSCSLHSEAENAMLDQLLETLCIWFTSIFMLAEQYNRL